MSLCNSIDTVAMAYLDDELAAEERHELETHLTECAACRAHVESERADLSLIRRALVAPPTPDLLRARIGKALETEDRTEQQVQRRRWYQYMLPGSAMIAAAAAIVMFVGMQLPAEQRNATVANVAAKQGTRPLPLEVQGPSTGPWLRTNFAPSIEPPEFTEPGTQLLGARLMPGGINGHDAALLSYQIRLTGKPAFVLSVMVVRDIEPGEWTEGTPVRVGNRRVHVIDTGDGKPMVSYVDNARMGYLFIAPELTPNELVWLVGRTNLTATVP